MVNDKEVLLIVGTSLESPVERASQQELSIDNHELVVHVVLSVVVSPDGDAEVCQFLAIVALVGHALIVGDSFRASATKN